MKASFYKLRPNTKHSARNRTLTCLLETGVLKLETSERQSLLLVPPIRIRLATPDMLDRPTLDLSHTKTKDAGGKSATSHDMPCRTSRLWTCHVFTTRDSQRLSAPNLSHISQLSGCHLLLSSFEIVATDRLSGFTASCSQHHNMTSRDENDPTSR